MADMSVNWQEEYLHQLGEGISDLRSRFGRLEDRVHNIETNMVTKEDLRRLEAAGKEGLGRLEAAGKDDLSRVETAIKQDLSRLEAAGKEGLGRLEAAGKDDLSRVEAAIKQDLNRVETRLDRLETKVDRFYWFLIGILGTTLASLAVAIIGLLKHP